MSLTLLQRFYEIAKQEAEAPALGLEQDGEYLSLPWWFVKSRVKHFGLGLLEAGAQAGEYFYLFPTRHPTWIYAELGALSMGLQTLPLPADLSFEKLQELFRKYPPSFLFWGDGPAAELSLSSYKTLRALISKSDDPLHPEPVPRPFFTFREIFNSGIRQETKHFGAYRKIRDSLDETRVMSPITVESSGEIRETPLRYEDVNVRCSALSQACLLTKPRRVFSDVNLWWTAGRVACLYWPLFLALQSIFAIEDKSLFSQLRMSRPDILYLSERRLLQLLEEMSLKFPLASDSPESAPAPRYLKWFRRRRISRWLRRQWGGKIKVLLSAGPGPAELRSFLDSAKIRSLNLAELGTQTLHP